MKISADRKKLLEALLYKSIFLIAMIDLNAFMMNEIDRFEIAPFLYMLFNLLIFNTLFFLPIILLNLKERIILKRFLLRIFVVGNTILVWYHTISDFKYLIVLILFDIVLFEIYLIRRLKYPIPV